MFHSSDWLSSWVASPFVFFFDWILEPIEAVLAHF